MQVCLTCSVPIMISQLFNPAGHKSCPVAECSDIVGIFLKEIDILALYNMQMT